MPKPDPQQPDRPASSALTLADLEMRTQSALRQWLDSGQDPSPFADLLIFRQAQQANIGAPTKPTQAVLEAGLAELRQSDAAAAELLDLRFRKDWSASRVAQHLSFAESTIFSKQKEAIAQLAVLLLRQEQAARLARRERCSRRIAAPENVELIGVAEQLATLSTVLTAAAPPWIVSIEGMGGSGKTALAAALMRQLIAHSAFDDFGWVSAQPMILDLGGGIRTASRPALTASALVSALVQQLIPEASGSTVNAEQALAMLQTHLKKTPHLITIDNLESVVDLEELLPTIQALSNPTKFVLTSRKRLPGERSLFAFVMPELSEMNSLGLVRQEARLRNLPDLAAATDAELRPIYATVGGNPLALLLVVGQLQFYALEVVLDGLTLARGEPVENLYTYIYQSAWRGLDEMSQRVLLAMPLVNVQGDSIDFVATASDLPVPQVVDALLKLQMVNLVQGIGDLHHRRYTIHSLTRSFLTEQVAKWT